MLLYYKANHTEATSKKCNCDWKTFLSEILEGDSLVCLPIHVIEELIGFTFEFFLRFEGFL
jgi:hypothetical protein